MIFFHGMNYHNLQSLKVNSLIVWLLIELDLWVFRNHSITNWHNLFSFDENGENYVKSRFPFNILTLKITNEYKIDDKSFISVIDSLFTSNLIELIIKWLNNF